MLKQRSGLIKPEKILTEPRQKLSRVHSRHHMKIIIPKEVSEYSSELYFEEMTDRV
jgi:hypothetical protein